MEQGRNQLKIDAQKISALHSLSGQAIFKSSATALGTKVSVVRVDSLGGRKGETRPSQSCKCGSERFRHKKGDI